MNLVYCLVFIIVCFCQNLQQNQAYEYCKNQDDEETRVCSSADTTHIVCYPDQVPSLGDVKTIVPMTEKMKNLFLDLHNSYRNNLACGNVKVDSNNFTKATRMRLLIWDNELSFIALIHAKQCNMVHDKCRNKQGYQLCGQNLAYLASTNQQQLLELSTKFVTMWFDEYKKITDIPGFAKRYPDEQKADVGHFTGMVNDKISRVGCALTICTRSKDEDKLHYHATCNYDYTNIKDAGVYDDAGAIGSKCNDWDTSLSSQYECLCENSGKIFRD